MFSVIKPFLDLCRVSNLPTVWTNVLGAVVLAGRFSWPDFLLLALSMSFFYAAGMCLNDLCDAEIDRQRKKNRPIPSGRISCCEAYVFTTALFAMAFVPFFLVSYPYATLGGLFLMAVIVVYDRFHKAHPLTVILMATCRVMIFVISAIAVTGAMAAPVKIAASCQFLYILIISVVARWENRREAPFSFPVIPNMIAGISLLDGIIMALFVSPLWLTAGIGGAVLTALGQRYVKGD